MPKSVPESKSALRQQVRALLQRRDAAYRRAASAAAGELLQKQEVWKKARSILFYAPLPEELDIWPLVEDALKGGKIVALLRYDPEARTYTACRIQNPIDDLRVGQFGIREPKEQCPGLPLDQLDLVLVPGVAFDLQGRRLGRGRGIYDRLLGLISGGTCGVTFEEQIVPEIPVESHDARVRCLLTPTRWVEI